VTLRTLLIWAARLSALAGIALIALAVVTRFSGSFRVGTFDVATVLFGGMVALVAGCLAYTASLAEYPGAR
jgi:hypothetical protein